MGLDIVEFVMAIESAFGIDIPNADAERLETPRLLIDYVASRVQLEPASVASTRVCLTQRAFYRSRAAIAGRLGIDRHTLLPESRLKDVLGERKSEWRAMGKDAGATVWPHLRSDHRLFASFGGVSTLGELAEDLATRDAAALRGRDAAWTRQEIEEVVVALIVRELNVDMSSYTLDSRFVRDMGCG